MTGRPFNPNDENRPLVPQHRTANAESGYRPGGLNPHDDKTDPQVTEEFVLVRAALCVRGSVLGDRRAIFVFQG